MSMKTVAALGVLALGMSVGIVNAQTNTPPSKSSPTDGRAGGTGPMGSSPAVKGSGAGTPSTPMGAGPMTTPPTPSSGAMTSPSTHTPAAMKSSESDGRSGGAGPTSANPAVKHDGKMSSGHEGMKGSKPMASPPSKRSPTDGRSGGAGSPGTGEAGAAGAPK